MQRITVDLEWKGKAVIEVADDFDAIDTAQGEALLVNWKVRR